MDLSTIEIPQDEAKARLAEYEAALRIERNAEDEAIAAGYRAAARGLPVVILPDVFERGGWFPNGLPRLAIARADARVCRVSISGWGRDDHRILIFRDDDWAENRGALVGRRTVRVAVPSPVDDGHSRAWRGTTTVPLVPPRHRPRRPRLHNFHVLWEVEAWDPTPARDPALLRHIRGDLWAVMATWDLSDLERAVLSQRI
jgi:hypothetical protein